MNIIKKIIGVAIITFVMYCFASACLAEAHWVWQDIVTLSVLFNPVGLLSFGLLTGWLFDVPYKD